jgi:hypothetical protein
MWSIFEVWANRNPAFSGGLSCDPLKVQDPFKKSLDKGSDTRNNIRGLYLSYYIVGIIKNKNELYQMNFPRIFLFIIFR